MLVDIAVSGDQNVSTVRFSPAGQIPIPTVPPNLTLADSARIGGKLMYTSSAEASFSPSAKVAAGIAYNQRSATQLAAKATRRGGICAQHGAQPSGDGGI